MATYFPLVRVFWPSDFWCPAFCYMYNQLLAHNRTTHATCRCALVADLTWRNIYSLMKINAHCWPCRFVATIFIAREIVLRKNLSCSCADVASMKLYRGVMGVEITFFSGGGCWPLHLQKGSWQFVIFRTLRAPNIN
jgi:hypothetical protein